MALHLALSRSSWMTPSFNISRISCYSESEEWSTIDLSPQFQLQFPKNIHSIEHEVVCSVNGLFCLSCYVGECTEYVLWNPSTGTFRLIPHPESFHLPCECSSTHCVSNIFDSRCGLGFVAESQDYNFVRFVINFQEARDVDDCVLSLPCSFSSSNHVAVYSYKNNSWKELPFPFGQVFDTECPSEGNKVATFVNGFLYWTTCKDVILSFELSSDKFSTLPYPDEIARDLISTGDEDDEHVFLLELDGSLGVMIPLLEKEIFSFWVYNGLISSPWTRKIKLDVRSGVGKPFWLGKKKNNMVLFLRGSDGALLEYNYSRRELKRIALIYEHCHISSIRMMMMASPYPPYVETNTNIAENDVKVDRISQLPDHILLSILSLLSLKQAASTSVLSTRWLDLWRHTPNLHFHNSTDHVLLRDKHKKYTKCINSVLESHKSTSVKEFSISFPLNNSTRRTLTKCLEFAFSRRVEILVLNFVGKRFTLHEKSSMLKLTNLTSLCLKCMVVSGETIGLFLRNCPLLERLIIKHAVLASDLEVCGSALKHLDIQYCKGGKSIKGYAPNLTYLRFHSGMKIVRDYELESYHDPPLICLVSSPLTTLEFTLHCPEIFLEKGFPQMPTLRELIITYYECCRGHHRILPLITSLICAFPYLEEFEIKQQHYWWPGYNKGMKVVNNVERFCHRHLRVFKFTWFDVGDDDHMELMSYILDNCIALQKIILHKYADDSRSHVAYWEYVKQLQSKLPSHIQLITS